MRKYYIEKLNSFHTRSHADYYGEHLTKNERDAITNAATIPTADNPLVTSADSADLGNFYFLTDALKHDTNGTILWTSTGTNKHYFSWQGGAAGAGQIQVGVNYVRLTADNAGFNEGNITLTDSIVTIQSDVVTLTSDNGDYYLSNPQSIPTSDPGVAGKLYTQAGALYISLGE